MATFLGKIKPMRRKSFGENANIMIDSLFYAKSPPKLKRYVNMARLETYEEIVAHPK